MEKVIMDSAAISRSVARMSHEIIEKNPEAAEKLCLVGVMRRGVPLAKRISENIKTFYGIDVPFGELDITLYRDDLSMIAEEPQVNGTNIDFSVKDKTVVIVDDVIFTGRTARAAIDAILSLGRPAKIQLAVLVDRGHRELPIRGDYVGKNLPTSKKEHISVKVPEFDGDDAVMLVCEQ